MTYIVTFVSYDMPPREDGLQWTQIQIQEGSTDDGPWTLIDTQNIDPTINPAAPEPLNFTTDKANLSPGNGWYLVTFVDDAGATAPTEPVFNSGPIEILATLDDVNAHFDSEVIEADANNTKLVQVSVARVVKGYLARILDPPTLAGWATPETTPDIIREIASMLIAAQVYFNYAARTSLLLENNNFAQRLYDEAIAMLNMILSGQLVIQDPVTDLPIVITSPEYMEDGLDYFPIDDTDRAFSMSQPF